MKPAIQKLFKNETFFATLLIFLTTLVTYGINIPKLGYYYDDWYMLWSGAARGAQSIIPLFSTDRPFMGVVYSVVYRFLGDTIVNWQLYALLWRFIGALAFFWILRLLWPNNKSLTAMMAVLFIVYPGFLSQPDANTKQNQLYGFGTGLLSIAFMLQAIKADSRKWKAVCGLLSVILTVNYLFIYEYMIGLEGMRLALLGYVLFRDGFRTWRILIVDVLNRWWPYVIASAGFLYWRLFIFEGARNATNASRLAGSYLNDLRHMFLRLVIGTAKDFLNTSIFAWFVKPYQSFSSAEYSNLGFAVLIAGIVIALVLAYSFLLKRWWGVDDNRDEKPRPIKDWVLIGAFSVVCAVAPVIASGRNVDLGDAYKSYGLHPMGGAVLLVGGLLLMLRPKFRKLALIALIGFSVSAQALNADYWGRLWNYERQTWWQLTWRAPDIKNDTLVMTYYPEGYQQQQDYETWGPVNLIYRPGPATSPAITSEVLNSETAYDILRKITMTNPVRDIPIPRFQQAAADQRSILVGLYPRHRRDVAGLLGRRCAAGATSRELFTHRPDRPIRRGPRSAKPDIRLRTAAHLVLLLPKSLSGPSNRQLEGSRQALRPDGCPASRCQRSIRDGSFLRRSGQLGPGGRRHSALQ